MRVSAILVKGSALDSALGRGLGSEASFLCHDSCLKSQVVRFIFEGSRPFVVKGSALGRGLGSEASFFCNDSCMKSEMLRFIFEGLGHSC